LEDLGKAFIRLEFGKGIRFQGIFWRKKLRNSGFGNYRILNPFQMEGFLE